ncbi:metal-dependent transcriptional regulator [Dolosigranulum pigrum]|uniref:metal-dependent transcriptional regulator n=1 Tax=Dolosigranulum pigrum TaxID=29394 RepID=UPI001AD873EA|nr:metal-dependent transcriptional regulator [Dolosigranulum pigrum]QTJ38888.1 metal-dependent transcriptional regulator [Dolosigranulum pigrum]
MTPNKENFLKAIYELGGMSTLINNKSLAEYLNVSAAAITDMNTRLVKQSIITYEPYKGVKLTDKGVRIVNQLIRRHRLWEVFLAEKLGYEWDEVHTDADLLEHISSDKLIERLDAFLGHPTVDPHGDTIPTSDGKVIVNQYHALVECKQGESFKVKQVDDDTEFLTYLTDKGIQLNETYQITEIEPYEGPITLTNNDEENILVSYKAAFRIFGQ